MICKIKESLNKADTECNTPRCDMCWYMEKYMDLKQDADTVRREMIAECGQDIFE